MTVAEEYINAPKFSDSPKPEERVCKLLHGLSNRALSLSLSTLVYEGGGSFLRVRNGLKVKRMPISSTTFSTKKTT